jgi:serine/threonine protein kinase
MDSDFVKSEWPISESQKCAVLIRHKYFAQLSRSQCAVYDASGVRVEDGFYQLQRELDILRKIQNKSEHIIELIEVVEEEELCRISIVFEFGGLQLMTWVDDMLSYSAEWKEGTGIQTFTEEETVCYAEQVLSGLHVIHSSGITHKDIKPQNLVIKNELIKIIDFNISEISLEIFDAQGTTSFTPPECFLPREDGEWIDGPARDLWSVGVTLFCMVFGQCPFEGNSPLELQFNIIDYDDKIPRIHELKNAKLIEKITILLNKSPKNRKIIYEEQN